MAQCKATLNIMAKQSVQGMRPIIMRLALMLKAKPKIVDVVMASTNIRDWYLSSRWRRYAKEDMEKPRSRQATSKRAGDGSKMNLKRLVSMTSGVIVGPDSVELS